MTNFKKSNLEQIELLIKEDISLRSIFKKAKYLHQKNGYQEAMNYLEKIEKDNVGYVVTSNKKEMYEGVELEFKSHHITSIAAEKGAIYTDRLSSIKLILNEVEFWEARKDDEQFIDSVFIEADKISNADEREVFLNDVIGNREYWKQLRSMNNKEFGDRIEKRERLRNDKINQINDDAPPIERLSIKERSLTTKQTIALLDEICFFQLVWKPSFEKSKEVIELVSAITGIKEDTLKNSIGKVLNQSKTRHSLSRDDVKFAKEFINDLPLTKNRIKEVKNKIVSE